jgi:hypothetical protein
MKAFVPFHIALVFCLALSLAGRLQAEALEPAQLREETRRARFSMLQGSNNGAAIREILRKEAAEVQAAKALALKKSGLPLVSSLADFEILCTPVFVRPETEQDLVDYHNGLASFVATEAPNLVHGPADIAGILRLERLGGKAPVPATISIKAAGLKGVTGMGDFERLCQPTFPKSAYYKFELARFIVEHIAPYVKGTADIAGLLRLETFTRKSHFWQRDVPDFNPVLKKYALGVIHNLDDLETLVRSDDAPSSELIGEHIGKWVTPDVKISRLLKFEELCRYVRRGGRVDANTINTTAAINVKRAGLALVHTMRDFALLMTPVGPSAYERMELFRWAEFDDYRRARNQLILENVGKFLKSEADLDELGRLESSFTDCTSVYALKEIGVKVVTSRKGFLGLLKSIGRVCNVNAKKAFVETYGKPFGVVYGDVFR